MAKVELKKPVVDEISANLEGAAGVVLVDHCGLTVEQDTQLRKQMREEGIVYKVYKNTMLNFAIKGTEFEPLSQHLEGPSAIAISKTDATAPARIVANFAKKAEKLGHPEWTVDPDCTCDVGTNGPAATGGNVAMGPGAEGKRPGPADECK